MESRTKLLIVGAVVMVLLISVSYFVLKVGYSNDEIRQRNLVTAQQETCKAFFDKMWKVLQQKAQVADEYKTAFRDIYPQLISGRYSNDQGGSQMFMKWVMESNPNFDISLYKELSAAIEAERTAFFYEQKKLISVQNQHKNMLLTFPGTWFLTGREAVEIDVITSEATASVYETKQENNIGLFAK